LEEKKRELRAGDEKYVKWEKNRKEKWGMYNEKKINKSRKEKIE
jgi:hypothetical protein